MFTFRTTCPICGSENKNPYLLNAEYAHIQTVKAEYRCNTCNSEYTVNCSDEDYIYKNLTKR